MDSNPLQARASQPAPGLSRRRFLHRCGFGTLAFLPLRNLLAGSSPSPGSLQAAFDGAMVDYMKDREIPGGVLAVAHDGRVIYTRGYGYADRDKKKPIKTDDLFRIASLSKSVTAVAVLQLLHTSRLKLDTPAFPLLPELQPAEPDKEDPRIKQITIGHLLHHAAGWDRDKSFDPMFRSRWIARRLEIDRPPSPREITRFMLGQPLDFEPGTRMAYSNFGYCVLGRIIEKLSGISYTDYVQRHVLAPIGIKRMRLGASRLEARAPDEVHYYMHDHALHPQRFRWEPRPLAVWRFLPRKHGLSWRLDRLGE